MFLINYIYMEEWFINFARLARLRNSYWTYDGEQTKLLDVCCVKLNNQHLPSQATRYPLNFQLSHFPFLAPFLIQVRHWIKIDNICNFRSRQSDGRTPSLLFSINKTDGKKGKRNKYKQDSEHNRTQKDCKPNIMNWIGEGRWNNILVSKAWGYPGDCWRILIKKISALSAKRPMSIWMSSTQYKTFRQHADSLRQGLLDLYTLSYPHKQIQCWFVSIVTAGKRSDGITWHL